MNQRFNLSHRFIGFLRAAFCALSVALLPSVSLARIYIADDTLDEILIFPNNASGNVAPAVIIGGSNTAMSMPFGVATDANFIYVANYENSGAGLKGNSVTIYPIDASGNAAPVATIIGSNTGLGNCEGIAVDSNFIYVMNESAVGYSFGSITIYPLTANGNVAPVTTIGFPNGSPQGEHPQFGFPRTRPDPGGLLAARLHGPRSACDRPEAHPSIRLSFLSGSIGEEEAVRGPPAQGARTTTCSSTTWSGFPSSSATPLTTSIGAATRRRTSGGCSSSPTS